jgi:hypothetical protein
MNDMVIIGGGEGSLGWENFFHPVSDLVIHFNEILAIAPPVLDIFAKKNSVVQNYFGTKFSSTFLLYCYICAVNNKIQQRYDKK